MLENLEQALAGHRPRRAWVRALSRRAAVALILQQQEQQTHVLMIQRAQRPGDPWSGQMAFPGGHMEPEDRHDKDAAARETDEEIGLPVDDRVPCIGRLSDIWARPKLPRPMIVTPYVFRLDYSPELVPNYEVADTVWIPLDFFRDPANRERMQWLHRGVNVDLPCYHYQGYRVWGLSLMMLDELVKVTAE